MKNNAWAFIKKHYYFLYGIVILLIIGGLLLKVALFFYENNFIITGISWFLTGFIGSGLMNGAFFESIRIHYENGGRPSTKFSVMILILNGRLLHILFGPIGLICALFIIKPLFQLDRFYFSLRTPAGFWDKYYTSEFTGDY